MKGMNGSPPLLIHDPGHPFRIHVNGTALNNPSNVFPPTKAGAKAALKEAQRKNGLMDLKVSVNRCVAMVYTINALGSYGDLVGYLAVRSGDLCHYYRGPSPREYATKPLGASTADAPTAAERDKAFAKSMADLCGSTPSAPNA